MAVNLGIDTGGTYTDAVLLDEGAQRILASAKALTTRPDLSKGIGAAIDAVLAAGAVQPADVALVSLSTTLATNALVEGQGGRVALVLIGFTPAEQGRAGLSEALGSDPLIAIAGGHTHSGSEAQPLDIPALEEALAALPPGITGFAVAASFATRNPAHELRLRALLRERTGLPVTCSHDLAAALGGPRRALTALLNARLTGLIDRLLNACEAHLALRGITAPLMVVRGDGALVPAPMMRERPIETILSGPAASVAGAAWLTGLESALVSDIGGTTTDVCLLQGGRPRIDPEGAMVGGWRTMVEAVAMRTTGLGGDSEVHLLEGLEGGLRLGPRRLMPVSLAAHLYPGMVLPALAVALEQTPAPEYAGRFALPLFTAPPPGLPAREQALAERLALGAMPLGKLVRNRLEVAALDRLVAAGHAMIAGVTPSDAAHVLGRLSAWDGGAATAALTLMARRRDGSGRMRAPDATAMAGAILEQLTQQSATCLLEAAFAEDPRPLGLGPKVLAAHPLTLAAIAANDQPAPAGVVLHLAARLALPIIALGASAGSYYPAVAARLGAVVHVPELAGVANAVGAVVGQVEFHREGLVTAPGPGLCLAHLASGPARFTAPQPAIAALEAELSAAVLALAAEAGLSEPRLDVTRHETTTEIEGAPVFIECQLRVSARGRPRIAVSAKE
jgi:N-methylhydantoinase A/oxoprolinase/acetone carboxylase beta subunit